MMKFQYMVKRWRAAIVMQSYVRRRIAQSRVGSRQKDIIILKSVIRGWLGRKQCKDLKNKQLFELKRGSHNAQTHIQEKYGGVLNEEVHTPIVNELERRIIKAEETLRVKEEENLMLRRAMKQYEQRWEDYEAKMKEMDHIRQKQLTSLQTFTGNRPSLSILLPSLSAYNIGQKLRDGNKAYDSQLIMEISLAAVKKRLDNDVVPIWTGNRYSTSSLVHPQHDTEDASRDPTPERIPPPPLTPPLESSMTLVSSDPHEVVLLLEEFQQRQQAFTNSKG